MPGGAVRRPPMFGAVALHAPGGAVRARGRARRLAVASPSDCLLAARVAPPRCTPLAPRLARTLHRPTENFPHRAGKIDGVPRPVNKFGKTHGALAAGAAFRWTKNGGDFECAFHSELSSPASFCMFNYYSESRPRATEG